MCLSNVYLEVKKQDKLVIEEAEKVSTDGEKVHVRSLMGDIKDLEGYYISEVDLIGNYVILKKTGSLEEMDDRHHENVRKLEIGLPYLLKHNREHEKDIKKWIQRAREAQLDTVVDDLQKVLELSYQISGCFESALNKLKRDDEP
jgi:predicted RNA-binding protein